MSLTDTAIRTRHPYQLSDGQGLYLLMTPAGGKWWRLDYRFAGKRKTLFMGMYPDVSLKDARNHRDTARKLPADGTDPGENRKAQKSARSDRATNSLEIITRGCGTPGTPPTGSRIMTTASSGASSVTSSPGSAAEVTAPDLLSAMRRIENRGALETARRALANCGQVFRDAVATGRCDRDPSGDLRGACREASGVTGGPGRFIRVHSGLIPCADNVYHRLTIPAGGVLSAQKATSSVVAFCFSGGKMRA
ncbi:MAG: tyrosine-type recombinase/integrase [Acidiferrobacteraceae bacterium]